MFLQTFQAISNLLGTKDSTTNFFGKLHSIFLVGLIFGAGVLLTTYGVMDKNMVCHSTIIPRDVVNAWYVL